MTAFDSDSDEFYAKLDELARSLKRALEISDELGWEEPAFTERFGAHELGEVLQGATWEVLHGVGWGGSGPNLDLAPGYADDLLEIVAIARRRDEAVTTWRTEVGLELALHGGES